MEIANLPFCCYTIFYVSLDEGFARRREAEKVVYVILRELNERYMSRKLKGFEAAIERH